MARPKKQLAEAKLKKIKAEESHKRILLFIKLVNKIRRSKNNKDIDIAFDKILLMMKERISQISYKFKIPGFSAQDVFQEALFALRYKAIKDYDQRRSNIDVISPFDRFAMLCIRRHLSTKLKASYQNKSRVLNSSISLDQDRNVSNSGGDDVLFLADILPRTDKDIISELDEKEYRSLLFSKLFSKLSFFEKKVLRLYLQRYSYQEIRDIINKNKKAHRINVKSVDNALSRVKYKAREIANRDEES